MTKKAIINRWILLPLALFLLVPWCIASDALRDERRNIAGGRESLLRPIRPGEFAGTVAAGGFRAVMIDYFWMRSSIQKRKKDYYGLRATYDMLSRLQPHDEQVWMFNSGNLLFDIAAQYHTPASRYHWVAEGLRLAKRGLEYVPESLELRDQLSFYFFYKFSYLENRFSRDFRRMLREESNPDYLSVKEKSKRSSVREALRYLNEILAAPPERLEKWGRRHLAHQSRIQCCDVLRREREIALLEARLDVLIAREALLRAAESERAAVESVLEKRRSEYSAIRRGEFVAALSEDEVERILDWRAQSVRFLRREYPAFGTGIKSRKRWDDAVDVILADVGRMLDLFERALERQDSQAVKRVIDADDYDLPAVQSIGAILQSNASCVNSLHSETAKRILKYVKDEDGGKEEK